MQCLFEGSDESPSDAGLGIIPGRVSKFSSTSVRVPHIGWNGIYPVKESVLLENVSSLDTVYFVHSYCAIPSSSNIDWALSITDYGDHRYMSAVQKGNIVATQFHPEKSGKVGLSIIKSFLENAEMIAARESKQLLTMDQLVTLPRTHLAKRVIACLDVRNNDDGDLVVTKGDQYDVREEASAEATGRGQVRNLGKPVALCKRYYDDGADEVVFLNITSFRQGVLEDLPMLQILEQSSENVFVPLTVGGGIREYTDTDSKVWSSLEVAAR
jgi:imidazole glycerol-phosphate synthase